MFLPIFFVRFREFTISYNNSKLFTQPIQYYYERIQNTRINKYNDKIYICMKRKIYLKYKDTIVKILMFYLKFSLKNIIWKKKIEKGEKKRKILGFLN